MTEAATKTLETVDILKLLKALPHRYPFLLVDRIIECDGDDSCIGIKNVTFNEPQFQGHFPDMPVMPGVLLIEGMAQTAGALCVSCGLIKRPKLVYFMTINNAKFRKPVEPGVLLRLEVEFVQKRSSVCKFAGVAKVDGQVVAEANFTAMIADPPKA